MLPHGSKIVVHMILFINFNKVKIEGPEKTSFKLDNLPTRQCIYFVHLSLIKLDYKDRKVRFSKKICDLFFNLFFMLPLTAKAR